MEGDIKEGTEGADDASTKPVSSLRSHFENIAGAPSATSNTSSREVSPGGRQVGPAQSTGRTSFDSPHKESSRETRRQKEPIAVGNPKFPPARLQNDEPSIRLPRQRPLSMGPVSSIIPSESSSYFNGARSSPSPLPTLPPNKPSYLRTASAERRIEGLSAPKRSTTPREEPPRSPFLHPSEIEDQPEEGLKLPAGTGIELNKPKSVAPPVNRADKPKLPRSSLNVNTSTISAMPRVSQSNFKASPFNTPPSSDGSPNLTGQPGFKEPLLSIPSAKDMKKSPVVGNEAPTPDVSSTRRPPPVPPPSSRPRSVIGAQSNGQGPQRYPETAETEIRPNLPPRRDPNGFRPQQHLRDQSSSPPRRIPMAQPRIASSSTPNIVADFLPPPRRIVRPIPTTAQSKTLPSYPSRDGSPSTSKSIPDQAEPQKVAYNGNESDEDEEPDEAPEEAETTQGPGDYPDATQSSRHHPMFRTKITELDLRHDTKFFAISGDVICTVGHFTRFWSLRTGEPIISMLHEQDGLKVTSLSFKSARNIGNEGTQIWLGFNNGDLQEIDIPSQSVVLTKAAAHGRRDVIRAYRYGKQMWTLDEMKLLVWLPGENGVPDLRDSPNSFNLPKGHTFSMVVGRHIWVATGRETHVCNPNPSNLEPFQVLSRPLSQAGVDNVTSGAVLGGQSEKVFFGHADGKVTIYDRRDYSCLTVLNVSVYKINSLAGVGDYLWAGFSTGMILVYDTSSTPWKIKKDWRAHEHPVIRITADASSVWKLDRLQVATLGMDNVIRVWDGMLEDDWLAFDVQQHDVDYCEFSEVHALVITWNAGASTPYDLQSGQRDSHFLGELFDRYEPPEILVFGFQELVDLEDKRTAARSFFKSSKKKDPLEHEHMKRQYRDWRDYLVRSIREYMPRDVGYELLHSQILVGLFSCIFVKSASSHRVSKLDASEVKRGMGGLAGNKGAIITRFMFDDTSICLVNCHLAAGQTQTNHRNNDIAAILESNNLSIERNPINRTDHFIGGGDGTMILDHEICILNGDLNYRIDSMPRDAVIRAIKAGDLNKLLQRDQLLRSRKRNPGFRLRAFIESPITFAPTYKYDVGTDRYDTSAKARSPAWCDRLLYRGIGRVKQLDYCRHEIYASDHRPVSGIFRLRVKAISQSKREATWEASKKRFEVVRAKMAMQAKLEFLTNTCGVDIENAQKLLVDRAG